MNKLQKLEVEKRIDQYIIHIKENVQELNSIEELEVRNSYREIAIDNLLNGRK